MKKSIYILILLIAVITFSYLAYAQVGIIYLDSAIHPNGTWNTTGNMTFSCNASVSADANITNVTLFVWSDGTAYTEYNTSSNTSAGANGTTVTRNFLLNNIPDAEGLNYTWGCMATDNESNINWSSTNNTFGIDSTGPTVSLISPEDGATNTGQFVTFVYNTSDLARSVTNCSLYFNNVMNSTDITILENTNQNITNTTPATDNLEWFISCYDNASNQGNSSKRSISTNQPTHLGGGGGGGSYSGTNYDLRTVEEQGITQIMRVKDIGTINVAGGTHTATIKSITETYVKLEVASTPEMYTIIKGKSKNIDVDKDGILDLIITFNSKIGNSANITFAEYTAPTQTTPTTVVEEDTTPPTPTREIVSDTPSKSPEDKTNTNWVWILGVVVIVIIATYFITKKKK